MRTAADAGLELGCNEAIEIGVVEGLETAMRTAAESGIEGSLE